MNSSLWVARKSVSQPVFRLFCFPYAGGTSASYLSWQDQLDKRVELCAIELPGRGARFREEPICNFRELIKYLAKVVIDNKDLPFAFFGHSLGALVAFETARFCMSHYLPMPKKLLVSGCASPQHPRESIELHKLDDEKLLEELRGLNGTPPEILNNREVMNIMLPIIRADFTLAADYKYFFAKPLNIPLIVLSGRHDADVQQEAIHDWRKESVGEFHTHWYDGDHFFIESNQQEVIGTLNEYLKKMIES